MNSRTLVLSAVSAAVLAACTTGGAKQEQSAAWGPVDVDPAAFSEQLDAQRREIFRYPSETAADIPALLAALPDFINVTYDELDLDIATGATVLRGVKVTGADAPEIGVSMGEVRFWGLDTEFALARLDGERLDETASLARRIEASEMALFGLETLANPVLDAYTDTLEDTLEGALDADPADPLQPLSELDFGLEIANYDLSIGRLIMDDVVLRPWTLIPADLGDADEDLSAFLALAQGYAAFAGAIALDTMGFYDMAAELSYLDVTGESTMSLALEKAGHRGLRGGDLDYSVSHSLTYDFNTTPSAENAEFIPPFNMAGSIDRYAFQGLRGDKLLNYLARGDMPDRTQTALLSLGKWTYEGELAALNGKTIYTVENASVDMTGFHWFAPTDISFDTNNMVYHVDGLAEFVLEMAAATGDDDPDVAEAVNSAVAAMAELGMDKLSFDAAGAWNWDAETGDAAFDLAYGLDDFMRVDMSFVGALPDFDGVAELVPEGGPSSTDLDAVEALFRDRLALSDANVNVVDEGGLEKGFALAVALANLAPEDGDASFIANSSPDALRQMASSMVYFGAAAMSEEFPPAMDLISAIAGFISEGGALHLALSPETPVTTGAIDALTAEFGDGPQAGVALIERLGLTLQHEAPETEGGADAD